MFHRSNEESPPEREPTPVEQSALGWVVRCERGLTREQESEFQRWLEASSEHRALFEEFGGTWTWLGRADEAFLPEAELAGRAYPASQDGASRPSRWRAWNVWLPLAAAAVIAIVFVRQPAEPEVTSVATQVGVMRDLQLSDGSVLKLNTDTVLTSLFTPGERRVRLTQGEAYFQVAKDASRPFVVEAAGVGVRAVGTAFNVRVHATAVEVLVTEGRVRVAPETTEAAAKPQSSTMPVAGTAVAVAELGAGERVSFPVAALATGEASVSLVIGSVAADELRRILAWREQRLEFSDTPLAEMVAEINRYHQHKLVVADASLAELRFGGSFRPDDRAGFVRILRENFGIIAEERGPETILRAAR